VNALPDYLQRGRESAERVAPGDGRLEVAPGGIGDLIATARKKIARVRKLMQDGK
jgi:hypothetical protein